MELLTGEIIRGRTSTAGSDRAPLQLTSSPASTRRERADYCEMINCQALYNSTIVGQLQLEVVAVLQPFWDTAVAEQLVSHDNQMFCCL